MILVYLGLAIVFIILLLCATSGFFKASLHKAYDKQIKELPEHSHLRKAAELPCPVCGSKLRLAGNDSLQCRECFHLFHSEYVIYYHDDNPVN